MMHVLLEQHFFEAEEPTNMVQEISNIVKQTTNLGIQNMGVFLENGKMVLTGSCRSFRTKQLAQAAAQKIVGDVDLVNRIHVA